jgi:hypothetical protein
MSSLHQVWCWDLHFAHVRHRLLGVPLRYIFDVGGGVIMCAMSGGLLLHGGGREDVPGLLGGQVLVCGTELVLGCETLFSLIMRTPCH